jgi:hypothetical protein
MFHTYAVPMCGTSGSELMRNEQASSVRTEAVHVYRLTRIVATLPGCAAANATCNSDNKSASSLPHNEKQARNTS